MPALRARYAAPAVAGLLKCLADADAKVREAAAAALGEVRSGSGQGSWAAPSPHEDTRKTFRPVGTVALRFEQKTNEPKTNP